MTAVNDENGQINVAKDTTGEESTIPHIMQRYKARSEPWMLVVDDNCQYSLPNMWEVCSICVQMARAQLGSMQLYNLDSTAAP